MRVPKKTSSRYDLLDSLSDQRVWTFGQLMEDTGRSERSCLSVVRQLEVEGLLEWKRRRPGQPTSQLTITKRGQQWLWMVNRDLPAQALDILLLLLEVLDDGPMLSSQVPGTPNGRAANAMRALRRAKAARLEMRRQGPRVLPSRLHITDRGRDLLRCFREEFP